MEIITTIYSENFQIHKIFENNKSKFPKSKIAAVAICAFTLNASMSTSQSSNGLHFSTKSKHGIIELSNETSGNTNNFKFDNGEGVKTMTEVKLNEIQRYFDDKLSDAKDSIHEIDSRTKVIENELKHIQSDIENIPNVIKSTLLEIEKEKNGKFWDRYGAPIITGIIVAVITTAGPFLLSIWAHSPKK